MEEKNYINSIVNSSEKQIGSFIDLDNFKIKLDIINAINKNIANKNCVFPFMENESELYVAMASPKDINILNDLRFVCKKNILAFKANKEQILSYIKLFYEIDNGKNAIEELKCDNEQKPVEKDLEEEAIKNAPSVRLIDSIIYQAISKKASDVHIEPFKEKVVVRLRIDGILQEIMKFPIIMYNSINVRIKIMAKMNITLRKTPQDGKIDYEKNGECFDFRVSSMPTVYGEKFAIRILYKSLKLINLNESAAENANQIKDLIKYSHGIILITGPTGSGKSTTMYAMLNELNSVEKNILTIEDPVEFKIDNVNQINVDNKVGLTFAAGLRSALRQDPDIILVGEIRDEETAQVAIRAAITGHLVLSTLHTNDAPSSVVRLIDMGIKPYLVADAIVAVIAQRLVRIICPYCKAEHKVTKLEKKMINLKPNETVYEGKGCSKCNNSGYSGRRAVFEIMEVDEKVRNLIYRGESIDTLREYIEEKGMINLREATIDLVKRGITTIEEYVTTIYNGREGLDEIL